VRGGEAARALEGVCWNGKAVKSSVGWTGKPCPVDQGQEGRTVAWLVGRTVPSTRVFCAAKRHRLPRSVSVPL
jgi:hypothetical protein